VPQAVCETRRHGSGVVLSTLTEASDADYRVAVIGDCCADLDPVLHECLVQRFFPTSGHVFAADRFAAAIVSPTGGA
jgi:nicotinamidase-related amidase